MRTCGLSSAMATSSRGPPVAVIGWNPHAYTFTIDGEQFERLLGRRRSRPSAKEVTARDVEQEIDRRRGRAAGLRPKLH